MSHKNENHTTIRLDDELLDLADRIAAFHEKTFGLHITRSAMLRAALTEGLAALADRYTAIGLAKHPIVGGQP